MREEKRREEKGREEKGVESAADSDTE